ncbi:MAG: FAD-dependent monooxygenase [Cyclobacteriaceae bacterium]
MKVGIIGGGITGLTTALALQKLGIQSVVYEQAKEINAIGAGIWLQPNAIKVLDWLGLKNEVKKQGIELDKMEITNPQLKPYKKIKSEVVQDAEGNQTVAIHRARLHNILYTELLKSNEVQLDKKYKSHTISTAGINLQFENGEDQVDILLGADGIDSLVRKAFLPESSVRSSGQVCWRGISKMNLPDSLKNLGQESWGKQIRFGFSQIHDGEVYWFAVANEEHLKKAEEVGRKEYLSKLFQDFSSVITGLIEHTEPAKIHQTILHDLNKLPVWYNGNICLIGDAAHATTPNMGQGACQGIEDAYYISRSLSKSLHSAEEAFQQFQSKRIKKVDYIVNTSWQFGKMAHSKVGQPLMKLMLKLTPESVMSSQMNKLYAIEN